jgi:peptidoglycan/xylan/chitin deacetylase (PgdA/CDA1 family)
MKHPAGGPARVLKEFVRGHSAWIGSVVALSPRAGDDPSDGREIALTYDDGPTPGDTEAVLDALAAAGAVATFFVLLTRAERQPAMIRTVAAAGHEVALHGPDHRRLTQFSARQVHRRTRDARRRLEDLLQAPVRWIRPPYGAQGPAAYAAIRAAGMEPVMWSASLHDTTTMLWGDRSEIVDAAIRPGAIVLGHDGYADGRDGVDDGPAPDLDRGRLAREVLERVEQRSLVPVTIGRAAARGGLVRRAWFGGR